MRLLLDTHVILWLLSDDRKLSGTARNWLELPARDVHYSVASLWEVGIKKGYGRLQWSPAEVSSAMRDSGYSRLNVVDQHLECIASLPHHHRDPFDRMLVAQAECEPMRLLTSDSKLAAYGPLITLV